MFNEAYDFFYSVTVKTRNQVLSLLLYCSINRSLNWADNKNQVVLGKWMIQRQKTHYISFWAAISLFTILHQVVTTTVGNYHATTTVVVVISFTSDISVVIVPREKITILAILNFWTVPCGNYHWYNRLILRTTRR